MVRYIIEARGDDGALRFDCPQPETFFGSKAISGISEDEIAKAIFSAKPDAMLDGMHFLNWAKQINPSWAIRSKTW